MYYAVDSQMILGANVLVVCVMCIFMCCVCYVLCTLHVICVWVSVRRHAFPYLIIKRTSYEATIWERVHMKKMQMIIVGG